MMFFAADFEPIAAIAAGGGPMKTIPALRAIRGESLVLRQEAVAWMNRLRAGFACDRDDLRAVEIALPRRRRTETARLVAHRHVHRVGIRVGIDGDRADAHSPRRTGDAARDLAAIGDENLVKHRRRGSSVGPERAEPAPVSLRTSARMKRQTFGMSQIISKTMRASTISAAIGCVNASHSTVPTASSSPNDADQFENGSGEVLINARLPAFAK